MSAHVQTQLAAAVNRRDHHRGPLDASVVLVEYGDFQCPYCATAHAIVQAVQEQMGDQLCYVFRNFPLTDLHEYAEHAAEAAEAAAAQGRYWEMHDMLFENQEALSDEDLVGYAADLGLDTRRFASDIVSASYAGKIRQDFVSGVKSDVTGTPTFFINGMRYEGDIDVDEMLRTLESQL
jgi:protein-disulfide isomerase